MSTLFKRHKENKDQVILLSYMGRVSFELIHSFIIDGVEKKLEDSSLDPISKKKIVNVLVEISQNLAHYLSDLEDDSSIHEDYKIASIKVWMEGDVCYIATGNYILNMNIEKLEAWLTKINGLNDKELRVLYKDVLNNGKFSDNGGGGLGFIDITRKSGNKLKFGFEEANSQFSYFNFEALINVEHT